MVDNMYYISWIKITLYMVYEDIDSTDFLKLFTMTKQEKIALKQAFKEYPEQSLIGMKLRIAYQTGWLKGYRRAEQDKIAFKLKEANELLKSIVK